MSLDDFKVFRKGQRWSEAGSKRWTLSTVIAGESGQQPLQGHTDGREGVRLETVSLRILGGDDGDLWPWEVTKSDGIVGCLFEEERRRQQLC